MNIYQVSWKALLMMDLQVLLLITQVRPLKCIDEYETKEKKHY